jgi:hypothetical protein
MRKRKTDEQKLLLHWNQQHATDFIPTRLLSGLVTSLNNTVWCFAKKKEELRLLSPEYILSTSSFFPQHTILLYFS